MKIIDGNRTQEEVFEEIKKVINQVNVYGYDLVTALKDSAINSPSQKLSELLNGLATTITSGGSLYDFFEKRSQSLLFDYRLEKEKQTKSAETFMDIYISIVIAAPMILLMLFVIMGSTGSLTSFLGLSINSISILMILTIVFLNIAFLVFLKIKQPSI